MHYSCTAREVQASGPLCGVQPVGFRYTGDFEANSDDRGRFHYHDVLLEYVAQAPTKRWCGSTSRRQPVTHDYCYSTISGSGFIKADQPHAPHTPEFWLNNETTTYHAINPAKNVTIQSVGSKPLFPMPTELPAVSGTYTIGQFYRQAGFDASVVARYPVRDFIMIVTHQRR